MAPSRESDSFRQLYEHVMNDPDIDMVDIVDAVSDEDPVKALEAIGVLLHWLDEREAAAVAGARGRGLSWFEIAERLGRTKPAVWQRYRHLDSEQER